jgi:hypothetical protein
MAASPSTFRRFVRLDGRSKGALIEALLILAAGSLAIRLLPFRRTAALMGGAPRQAHRGDSAEQARTVNRCAWALNFWADRVPWRAVCFQRGLALHWMLRRRRLPSVLHYGVAQSPAEGLRAHVWVSSGGRIAMGGEQAPDYTCLASFPAAIEG